MSMSQHATPADAAVLGVARLGALAVVLLAATLWSGVTCAVCGKAIEGKYLQAGERTFCSLECFRTTLPVCAVCGKRIEGGHLVHEGKHYCSESCFRGTLPTCAICGQALQESFVIGKHTYCKAHAEGPRCDACGLPAAKLLTLPDGRVLCADCRPLVVLEADAAAPLYAKAGQELALMLGQALPAAPPLELVGRDQLPAHPSGDSRVTFRELGRYLRDWETTTTKNLLGMTMKEQTEVHRKVLILYGLPPDRFVSTAVHELTHDLLAERHPGVEKAPAWVSEGVCQYTAAGVCRRLGYGERLAEIEAADDPIYGAGYRYLTSRFGASGWPRLARWLDSGKPAALPAQAPAPPAP